MADDHNRNLKEPEPEPFLIAAGFGICVSCVALSITTFLFLLSVIFVLLEVPLGIEPITFGKLLLLIYRSAIVPLLALLADILRSFSPWGFVAFGAMLLVLKGPNWIREAVSSGRWKIGGVEYDGSIASSTFKRELIEAAKIVERANKEIGEAYEASKNFASTLRDKYQIGSLTGKVAKGIAEAIGPNCPDDYRMTLYIPDLVFGDQLYQFTEYYDRMGDQVTERKAGRTFSVRYGIIGRVWRSGVSEVEGQLLPKEERELLQREPTQGPIEKFIARRWGLSLDEAIQIRSYNSYGAIRLEIAEVKVGEIFFYSKEVDAFGKEELQRELLNKIEGVLDQNGLKSKLLEVSRDVAPWSGRIQVFKNS